MFSNRDILFSKGDHNFYYSKSNILYMEKYTLSKRTRIIYIIIGVCLLMLAMYLKKLWGV